ncbi:MAG: hypothetical protein AAGI90_06550 [Chlamydiota bacterium]
MTIPAQSRVIAEGRPERGREVEAQDAGSDSGSVQGSAQGSPRGSGAGESSMQPADAKKEMNTGKVRKKKGENTGKAENKAKKEATKTDKTGDTDKTGTKDKKKLGCCGRFFSFLYWLLCCCGMCLNSEKGKGNNPKKTKPETTAG